MREMIVNPVLVKVFLCENYWATNPGYEMLLKGQTYKSQRELIKELTRCAREARKCYRKCAFGRKGWMRVDPESYHKAVELGVMREILSKVE